MKLTILGCHSATPRANTHPTAQLLEIKGHLFLIDCGEGTQVRLRAQGVKFSRIKHIFISHLHGDHYLGLMGLLSTFQLLGREAPVTIHAPLGLKAIINLQLQYGGSKLSYPLHFNELTITDPTCIFNDATVQVYTLPLTHRIYTNGFLFKEKEGLRKVLPKRAEASKIHKAYFGKLAQGFDVKNEAGILIKNHTVTENPTPPKSYAFCSDTAYNTSLVPLLHNVDCLYHESTFLEAHHNLAKPTGHSTAIQAAKIAKQANVKQLILGHFSTRYNTSLQFKEEAETVFKPVFLAQAGLSFTF